MSSPAYNYKVRPKQSFWQPKFMQTLKCYVNVDQLNAGTQLSEGREWRSCDPSADFICFDHVDGKMKHEKRD